MSITMNVRTHRTSRKWSVAELAKRSGVSEPTIERIEAAGDGRRSDYDPRLSRVVAIANAFGVCVDALIHERAHEANLPETSQCTPHAVTETTRDSANTANGTSRGRNVANENAPGRSNGA